MKIKPIIITASSLLIILLGVTIYADFRGFISNPEYMKWALFGGEYKPDYILNFRDDNFSQNIVKGKSVEKLKKWFPEMRSERWRDDYVEKLLNPDYEPQRESETYITGIDNFMGIFIEVENGKATRAKILKDIPNQRFDPIVKTPVD